MLKMKFNCIQQRSQSEHGASSEIVRNSLNRTTIKMLCFFYAFLIYFSIRKWLFSEDFVEFRRGSSVVGGPNFRYSSHLFYLYWCETRRSTFIFIFVSKFFYSDEFRRMDVCEHWYHTYTFMQNSNNSEITLQLYLL